MPLPKRSKLISKRFKKPAAINPAISPPSTTLSSSSSCFKSSTPWRPPAVSAAVHHHHHHHQRHAWRIRVICTDPDATDDSSSDEADLLPSSPSPSTAARKRLIHEICLPFPSPVSQRRRPRPIRSLCRDFSIPASESPTTPCVAAPDNCVSSICAPSPSSSPSTECRVTEEEFRRFLSEFLPDEEDGCVWDCDLGRSGLPRDCSLAEMLDLELDSEALSWINSMQR